MSSQNIQYSRERKTQVRSPAGASYHHFTLSGMGDMPFIGPERYPRNDLT
jgi:hypothetical protein